MINPTDIIPPHPIQPNKARALLVPVAHELKGQSELIAKNAGLALLKPKFFVIDVKRMEEEESVNQPGVGLNSYDKKGIFGLPVFDTITLNNLSYEDFEGNIVNLGNFTLDIALIETFNPRHFVITEVAGRNGDVVEYMSDGDWIVKIHGMLVNPLANIPPENLIRALHGFCKSQTEIKVNSTFLSYLDIFSIVIVEPKFTQKQGARNAVDFELQCRSITPFELGT